MFISQQASTADIAQEVADALWAVGVDSTIVDADRGYVVMTEDLFAEEVPDIADFLAQRFPSDA